MGNAARARQRFQGWRRSLAKMTLLTVAVGAVMVGSASSAYASHMVSKPVVFVHGIDALGDPGDNCEASWGEMMDALRDPNKYGNFAWTGRFYPMNYYSKDINCDLNRSNMSMSDMNHHGDHGTFYAGDPHTTHTTATSIRHLAYHWAWWVYDHHTKDGRSVEAVGHSMGGIIMRYGINAVQRGFSAFPSRLLIDDVVTLGSPHKGVDNARFVQGCTTQCTELDSSSSLIKYLGSAARNPQGAAGTRWTAIGSHSDNVVDEGSAIDMDAMHTVRYLSGDRIGHSDYMHKTRTVNDAHLVETETVNGDTTTRLRDGNGRWPVTWSLFGLGHTSGCPHAWTFCTT